MNTLIIYASTYGYTEEMVNKMVNESNHKFDSINILKNKNIELKDYENIIIGSCIYVGQINKELKKFVSNNHDELMHKNVGLFLACAFEEQFKTHLTNNFSQDMIDHSQIQVNLGGKLQKDRMNFAHKVLVNMIEKTEEGKKPVKTFENRTLEIVNHFNRA
jgi:menaquinone-dependent protoporphyrinogen oxidase